MQYEKMNQLFLFILIIGYFHFVPVVDSQEPVETSQRSENSFPLIYEAEDGDYVGLTLQISSSASNGQFLRMEDTGSVIWNVTVDEAGWYNLKLQYQSPQSDKVNDLIKNGDNWPMGFRWANYWTFVERLVGLNGGSNTIILSSSGGGIDIDYLMIDTVTVVPEITPKNNVFYSRVPRNIIMKMNAYGREITSVSVTGFPLSFSTEPYPYEEDGWLVKIDSSSLLQLPVGHQDVLIEFDTGESSDIHLNVMVDRLSSILTIIAPYVDHGNAVLFIR